MPVHLPTRTQISLDLGLQGYGDFTYMERAFVVRQDQDQPTATKECAVHMDVEILCFSRDPTGAYSVLIDLIPSRLVHLVGDNNTLLDATTFEELAWRNVRGGETPVQFIERCDREFAQPTILQGDGFNVERDLLASATAPLMLHHLQRAAEIGRLKRLP